MKNVFVHRAGILAPLFFVSVFTLDGIFQHDYDAFKMHISALSLGPYGWIQIGNFMIFGLLLFLFSWNVLKEFNAQKRSKTGPVILLITSICFFLSGPFVMDPMGTPQNEMTLHGIIHGLLGGIVFILMPVTCFVFYFQYRLDSSHRNFNRWSLMLGILSSIGLISFTAITKSIYLNELFYNWQGLFQRSVILPYLFWLFLFGLTYAKQKNQQS